MFKKLATALLLRRVVQVLTRLADALDTQTQLLVRMVDRIAPALPEDHPADRAKVRADTGVSFLDAADAGLALDFIERTAAATGHTPDDEEILIYLADEKTHDLASRLAARDVELARLAEERR
jgi:hypothetical protein